MVAAAAQAGARTPSPGSTAPVAAAAPGTPDAAPAASAADPAAADADHIGYLFGLVFGEQLHGVGITDQLTIESIERGLKAGLHGELSTPADRQQVQQYVQLVRGTAITRNQAAAKAFLERNAREKGVTSTASGLQYKIILPGDRKAAAILPTDSVTVQYRGKLLDGSEFDSTYKRGAPIPLTVNGVIPGWQEALVLMKPGAKWQLFVPPELGYGANPRPGIPGGSLLIFEIEVLSVAPRSAPAPSPH